MLFLIESQYFHCSSIEQRQSDLFPNLLHECERCHLERRIKLIVFYKIFDILPGKAVGENCPMEGAAREAKTHPKNTKTNNLIRFIGGIIMM